MYDAILNDPKFYQFLVQVDRDLADRTRRSRCRFCGAPLHSARYLRRPRGLPVGIDPGPEFCVCFSFCCSADGCRRRHRAPSVRFLGPKVYLSAMVVMLTAMAQGPTPRSARRLNAMFGADRRTLGGAPGGRPSSHAVDSGNACGVWSRQMSARGTCRRL